MDKTARRLKAFEYALEAHRGKQCTTVDHLLAAAARIDSWLAGASEQQAQAVETAGEPAHVSV